MLRLEDFMNGLICPECNEDKHVPKYEMDGLFVCQSCGKVLGYLCRGCDTVYLQNRLGKHGDVWECKLCGQIQWGYTEYKRSKAEG